MGKRIIPLLAADPIDAPSRERLAKVLAEDQGLTYLFKLSRVMGSANDPTLRKRLVKN
jgi:hypothetical protein